MRVLHLTLAADAGGLSRYIVDLCVAMRDRGVESVVAGDAGAWDWAFAEAGVEYVRVPLKAGVGGLLKSRRVLKGRQVDLIHTHYRRATLLGRLLRTGAPLLYTLHLSHLPVGGWRRVLSDFGDHSHVPSRDGYDWLTRDLRVPADRVSLIPHGVDTGRFTPGDTRTQFDLPPGATVACYVGRLDEPKNETWCLDALEGSDACLLVAGEGPREGAFREQVDRRGLAGRVTMLGHADPLAVYRAADVLLLPSGREGFSLVCAEAMAVGVPHVRTRTSGHTELTVAGVTGWATAIERRAWVDAAKAALADRRKLRAMAGDCVRHVVGGFTFERQVGETLGLYERLAG